MGGCFGAGSVAICHGHAWCDCAGNHCNCDALCSFSMSILVESELVQKGSAGHCDGCSLSLHASGRCEGRAGHLLGRALTILSPFMLWGSNSEIDMVRLM